MFKQFVKMCLLSMSEQDQQDILEYLQQMDNIEKNAEIAKLMQQLDVKSDPQIWLMTMKDVFRSCFDSIGQQTSPFQIRLEDIGILSSSISNNNLNLILTVEYWFRNEVIQVHRARVPVSMSDMFFINVLVYKTFAPTSPVVLHMFNSNLLAQIILRTNFDLDALVFRVPGADIIREWSHIVAPALYKAIEKQAVHSSGIPAQTWNMLQNYLIPMNEEGSIVLYEESNAIYIGINRNNGICLEKTDDGAYQACFGDTATNIKNRMKLSYALLGNDYEDDEL